MDVDKSKNKDQDNPPRRRQRLPSFLDLPDEDEPSTGPEREVGPQPTPEELREIFDALHGPDGAKGESADDSSEEMSEEISDALGDELLGDELLGDDADNDEDPGDGPHNDPRRRPG